MEQLDRIERRLATFAPIQVAGNDRRRRTIDVGAELKKWSDLLWPVMKKDGIDFELDFSEDNLFRVEMRPELFGSVVQILAMNSMDWQGPPTSGYFRIRARGRGDTCEILFSDGGPGIPRELTCKVFEPTFSTREAGNGMGLTIARAILEDHGGSIEILVDGRRRGANLLVSLPRKRATSLRLQ